MLNSYQISLISDLNANKDRYLSLAQSSENISEINALYARLLPMYRKYLNDLFDDTGNRILYQKALDARKIDPYIAGGIGQGIGGVGAGVYSAINAASNNENIDAQRSYYRNAVNDSSITLSFSETEFLSIVKKLDDALNSIDSIRKYREEEKEKKYLEALELSKKNIRDSESAQKAQKAFESLGHYKDSNTMAKKCRDKLIKSLYIDSTIVSTVFALIFTSITTNMAYDSIYDTPLSFSIFIFLVLFFCAMIGTRPKVR